MTNYEVIEIDLGTRIVKNIKATFTDTNEVLIIPLDPNNSDYQVYLASLEQSTPNVIDEA
jgi:hypothetical protein